MRHATLSLLAFTLAACVSVSPYQKRGVEVPLDAPISLEDAERDRDLQLDLEARSIEAYAKPDFTIGVIELTDGGLLNASQYDQVMAMVRTELADPAGAILVVFAHGWHHGCSTCDRDIACFRRVIGGVSEGERKEAERRFGPGAPPRRVVGIYLGWRGRRWRGDADVLSIWDRKATAEHIGGTGAKEVLNALHAEWAARQQRENGRRVTMVSIGHSLGGAMLFSAVKERLSGSVNDIFRGSDGALRAVRTSEPRSREKNAKAVRARFGDLVVLVNPAIEASAYKVFDDDLYDARFGGMSGDQLLAANMPSDKNRSYGDRQLPVLVTLASSADTAVGRIFPVSRVLAGVDLIGMRRVFTRREWRQGLGHYEPQVTHVLSYDGPAPVNPSNGGCACSKNWSVAERPVDLRSSVEQKIMTREEERRGGEMTLTLAAHRDPACSGEPACRGWDERSPYLVIRTDHTVIADHNDIFNPVLVGFLTSYIRSFEQSKDQRESPAQAY